MNFYSVSEGKGFFAVPCPHLSQMTISFGSSEVSSWHMEHTRSSSSSSSSSSSPKVYIKKVSFHSCFDSFETELGRLTPTHEAHDNHWCPCRQLTVRNMRREIINWGEKGDHNTKSGMTDVNLKQKNHNTK